MAPSASSMIGARLMTYRITMVATSAASEETYILKDEAWSKVRLSLLLMYTWS
jgi:hypothetical protein